MDKLSNVDHDFAAIERTVEKELQLAADNYGQGRFDLLVGFSGFSHPFPTRLYRSHGDHCLRPIDPGDFSCVGMDTSLAQFLLGNLFDSQMGIDEAAALGIHVTSLMKTYADGVGGPITMFKYRRSSNRWEGFTSETMAKVESTFPPNDLRLVLLEYGKARFPNRVTERGSRVLELE